MRIAGAIIAGGASQRFGSDKAAALLSGRALIDHIIDAILPQVDTLIIAGRAWGGFPTVPDHPFSCGPLSGLCAAMHWAEKHGYDHILTAGCDVLPILPDLGDLLAGDGPAVISGQPLLGFWPSSLATPLETHICAQSSHAFRCWIAASGARELASPVTLYNMNTAEDLARFIGA